MQAFTARLLVVDDDELFRRATVRQLKAAGFEVLEADNFAAAMTVIEQTQPIDLLLTDLHLTPGKPHGFSIARVVKIRYPQIKTVFMTGGDAQGFALSGPGDVVLQKPIRAQELIGTVKAALGL